MSININMIAFVAVKKNRGSAQFAYFPSTNVELPPGWDWNWVNDEEDNFQIDTCDCSEVAMNTGLTSLEEVCRFMNQGTGTEGCKSHKEVIPPNLQHMFERCACCGFKHTVAGLRFCSYCGANQKGVRGVAAVFISEELVNQITSHPSMEAMCTPEYQGGKHRLWLNFRKRRNSTIKQRWNFCPCCGEPLED